MTEKEERIIRAIWGTAKCLKPCGKEYARILRQTEKKIKKRVS